MGLELKNLKNSHFENGRNMSEMTKEELYHHIYHDSITGYYNWTYMWKHLDKRYRDDTPFCFAHFNIKDMKMVNDIYGHEAANDLLISICNALEEERRAGWVLQACRCDNDNFSMMLKVLPEEEITQKLTAFFEKVSRLPCNQRYKIYYRCGVVTADDALATDDRVADYAKVAQNLGQAYHKTEIFFFNDEMYEGVIRGKKLLARIDTAIAENEFQVYLQPKYDIHTEKIVGAEALVRWNYEHKKMLPPYEFIPLFEETGMIFKIDQEVLRQVCDLLARMIKEGLTPVPVSVNLSRIRVKSPHLKNDLLSVIDAAGIPHNLIEFELTESAAYNDDAAMIGLLNDLHSLGFMVSLDDFGTGYSSLSILRKIPMDTLKIDKSFVDVISFDKSETRENYLIKDIITMSKHLGFVCLAEGAESKEQVDFLRSAGCDKIQGYYYSKPVPESEFLDKIRAN